MRRHSIAVTSYWYVARYLDRRCGAIVVTEAAIENYSLTL